MLVLVDGGYIYVNWGSARDARSAWPILGLLPEASAMKPQNEARRA